MIFQSCLKLEMTQEIKGKVCIVVLGDIGRSPRMQYHGMSLVHENYSVTFVGYEGSRPLPQLTQNNNVKFRYIRQSPQLKTYLPLAIAYAIKVIWQIVTLFWVLLFEIDRPDYILYQNPPAVASLGVCYVYCKLFKKKLIIDWHNYAYSILALSLGINHRLVKLSKFIEFYIGRKSDYNLCVTRAMEKDLKNKHNINAITFYDRPPPFFEATNNSAKHKLFLKLGHENKVFLEKCGKNETVFTRLNSDSEIVLRDDRPAFIISSTSWTEDEDFSILLAALEDYEEAKKFSSTLPNLICAITGKGPLKEFYVNIINKKNWKYVQIITPWLEPEDYPTFLGSADLGICLHKSSSGLDLPMKIIDMFGCCVPVCAINFQCLNELVKHEINGFIFNDEKELSSQIKNWFQGFPHAKYPNIKKFQENLQVFRQQNWHNNWKLNVEPLFVRNI